MTRPVALVVDDDPDFLEVVRSILESASPPVTIRMATTGTHALRLLERCASPEDVPAFIVLDMRLPDMTAVDVLRRGGTRLAGIPLVVLTQALWQADATAARDAGAIDIREKPSRLPELRALLLDVRSRTVLPPNGHHPSSTTTRQPR